MTTSTSPGELAEQRQDRWLLASRLVVSAALLAFAHDARPQAPELAGGVVALVGQHWLPAAIQAIRAAHTAS